MENNSSKKNNAFISEEEKTLNWEEIQNSFLKNFGSEIYNSWLQKISLVKEYNDYLILGVPTRFFRDWIVSRYLDKILEQVKNFKLSLNRIEFKIIEENKQKQEYIKIEYDVRVIVEQVSAMPGQGVTSMFNFGQSFGILKGICSAMRLPIYFVRPAKWKKYFSLINSEKDASRTRAIEIFPYFSSQLSKKKDSNKADAILIARFYYETYKIED